MSFVELIHDSALQGDASHFDVAAATRLGRACGTALRRRTGGGAQVVVLGRGGNGDELVLRDGLARGLLLSGHDVRDVGVASAELFAFAISHLGAAGGVLVQPAGAGTRTLTFSLGKRPLAGDALLELASLADGEDFSAGAGSLALVDVVPAARAAAGSAG